MEIAPFADEHLDAAARLLAARHRRHREAEPLLPNRYEDPAEARREIEAARSEHDASGFVALEGGTVTGYLIGAPRARSWGPNVWIGYAGHAVEEPETVRDLYAAAAAGWVGRGWTAHYALVPAFDRDLVDAWFRLAFGQMHVHAIREAPHPEATEPEVREATRDDLEGLLAIDHILPGHLNAAPVFARGEPDPPEVARKEWLDTIDDERSGTFVAVRDGRIVGSVIGCPADYSRGNASLARPDGAGMLGYTATAPEVRGEGAGLALTHAVYRWARERGYETLITDWRAANLPSSRFFGGGRGFRPTFFRLHRLVGY
jgi:GNAT superfamily N-acetyltransferase